jgi:hypothetical protein
VTMHYGEYCIMREETMRKIRGSYNGFCCRLYPFICWIIIKEGPDNFSGGRSPHWVNYVNLCLYCIVYLLFYFISSGEGLREADIKDALRKIRWKYLQKCS